MDYELDRLDTTSYSLMWCGAEFVNDEDGAQAHIKTCPECRREMFDRWVEREAAPRVVATDG